MIITLSGSAPPTDQIRDQIWGLISSGLLAADERLPSVRQLAKDLDVAPGTVAKAYKSLEAEGYLTARTGGGTRVGRSAARTAQPVLEAARHFAGISSHAGADLEETIRVLRAVWPER
jgi:GntR family transcriptional regulator